MLECMNYFELLSCPEIGLHISVNKNQDDTQLINETLK